jgi:hypothetical protein
LKSVVAGLRELLVERDGDVATSFSQVDFEFAKLPKVRELVEVALEGGEFVFEVLEELQARVFDGFLFFEELNGLPLDLHDLL